MFSVLRYMAAAFRNHPSEMSLHCGDDIMLMPISQSPPDLEVEPQSALSPERTTLTDAPTPWREREAPARHSSGEDDEETRGRSLRRQGEEHTPQSCAPTSSPTDNVLPFHSSRASSPYPHPQLPPHSEIELFPEFVDTWTDWDEGDGDGGAQDAYMQHCLVHCKHIICRATVAGTKDAEGRDWVCRGCKMPTPPITVPVGMARIAKMTRGDVENTRLSYEQLDREETVTVDLQSAIAIVEKLESLDILDIHSHLLALFRYGPSSLFNHNDYFEAVRDANTLLTKLPAYFKTSLEFRTEQTRKMTVWELEQEMRDCMRLEVMWWVCKWCMPSTHCFRNWFFTVIAKFNRGEITDGVKVLMERVEEVVPEVVAVLVWWDRERPR